MDRKIIEEHIVKINPDALFADGYDRSIKGIGFRDTLLWFFIQAHYVFNNLWKITNGLKKTLLIGLTSTL